MKPVIKIFNSPVELAEKFAEYLINLINESAVKKRRFTVALSGGSTPELLFSILGGSYSKSVQWQFVHFFWGDERCVPPDNGESNYGAARRGFLDKIDIPAENIHRIRGEDYAPKEAERYSEEILSYTDDNEGLPLFDLIILGLGEDGHTASLFPGHLNLLNSDKICAVASHPVSGQNRITITFNVINNAASVVFLASGKAKSMIIDNIIKKTSEALNYPASYIVPYAGSLVWFIDRDAALLLKTG